MTCTERIKIILKEKKLQQKDLAASIGVSPATLSGWFCKGRDFPSAYLLPTAEFLRVPVIELLTDDINEKGPLTEQRKGDLTGALEEIGALTKDGRLNDRGRKVITELFRNNANMLKKLIAEND